MSSVNNNFEKVLKMPRILFKLLTKDILYFSVYKTDILFYLLFIVVNEVPLSLITFFGSQNMDTSYTPQNTPHTIVTKILNNSRKNI